MPSHPWPQAERERCSLLSWQVPFDIPVTFTIVPHDPLTDRDGFLRYAMRMNGLSEAEFHTILTGVIHGQTRILAGGARASTANSCSTSRPDQLWGSPSILAARIAAGVWCDTGCLRLTPVPLPRPGTLNVLDIFNGRDAFKAHVQEKVEKVLAPTLFHKLLGCL